jgi:hypothetical protein
VNEHFDFNTQECALYKQCDFDWHEYVITTRKSVISTRTRVITTRRVRFPQAEGVLYAECDLLTHGKDYDTLEYDFHMQCYSDTHEYVITIRTSGILTHTRVITTRRVRFPHAECDFIRRV